MNPVSLTLTFDSLHEAQAALAAMAGADSRQAKIDANDRPDTGVSADEKAAVSAALPVAPLFNPFAPAAGAAVAQVPPPPPVPSTAVAAVPSTVPAAPPVTSAAPPVVGVPPAPPLAPTAAVPAVPAVPPSPAGIEVDADGLPWDARIHAGGRAKNADGRWRQKRGLNDGALKARVEAELRQAMGVAATASVPVVPTVPVVPSPPTTASPNTPATSGAPTPPLAVPAAPAAEETAPQFLARIGGMLASGALTQDKLSAALAAVGLTSMSQLVTAPALVPLVRAQL